MNKFVDLLSSARCIHRAPFHSQRKIFERISEVIDEDYSNITYDEVYTALQEREKIGSTAIGEGIAIPHCRLESCEQPIGCLILLDKESSIPTPDDISVDLIFALVVPTDAHEQHLELLSEIALRFQDKAFCQSLRESQNADELYQLCINYKPAQAS